MSRNQPSAARGTLRIALFFGLLGAAAFIVHHLIGYGLRRIPTSDFGISNKMVTGNLNAEILISGSSRALNHYDSRIIQEFTGLETFNFGRDSSQIDMELSLFKTYLKHNKKPRLLIQNLDSFSFVTTDEVFAPGQYIPYLNEESLYATIQQINPSAWKWKYVPLYGYAVEDMRFSWILGLKAIFGFYPAEDHFEGYSPSYKEWTGDFELFKANHQSGVSFAIQPAGKKAFTELLTICRDNDIPVLLVYSPVFFEMQQLEKSRARVFQLFHELSKQFDVTFWDFSDLPICHDRRYFYNSQHLNVRGATLFTNEVAKRLRDARLWEISTKTKAH